MDTTGTFWLPGKHSTFAGEVDSVFYFIYGISIFFFVLIVGLMIYFVIRYRRRKNQGDAGVSGPVHNNILEMAWIIIPFILVIIIFILGFRGFMRMNIVPKDALEIKVTGQKWFWSFDYPEGATAVNEMVVPVNKPVKLLMSSTDVIHSFFVPSFRIKRDVLPNRYSVIWFEATDTGVYDIFCTEYCGTGHSDMLGKVKVVSVAEYEDWLSVSSLGGEGMSPAEYGAKLYVSKACVTCHSIDGTRGNGPSFKSISGMRLNSQINRK
ncbi:cytochrome c oxidase subunit II [Calditrichota bacterium]